MDDRIAELRKAVEHPGSLDWKGKGNPWRNEVVDLWREAAREWLDLLDSGALIIRRDEDGEWPADVIARVGPILEPHPSWSDPLHYRASLVVLREATVRKLDALASSQGVEP